MHGNRFNPFCRAGAGNTCGRRPLACPALGKGHGSGFDHVFRSRLLPDSSGFVQFQHRDFIRAGLKKMVGKEQRPCPAAVPEAAQVVAVHPDDAETRIAQVEESARQSVVTPSARHIESGVIERRAGVRCRRWLELSELLVSGSEKICQSVSSLPSRKRRRSVPCGRAPASWRW